MIKLQNQIMETLIQFLDSPWSMNLPACFRENYKRPVFQDAHPLRTIAVVLLTAHDQNTMLGELEVISNEVAADVAVAYQKREWYRQKGYTPSQILEAEGLYIMEE